MEGYKGFVNWEKNAAKRKTVSSVIFNRHIICVLGWLQATLKCKRNRFSFAGND